MKLNKYISSLLIAASAVAMTGCNDFLDRKPLGQNTEDDAPGGGLDGQVFSIYTLMRSYNITAGIPAFLIENVRSEDSEKGSSASDGADNAAMYDEFNYVASNGTLGAYWNQCYSIIYQANSVISSIEESGISDEATQKNLGEAYFFRAYAYFDLVRAWGEVPLIDFKITDSSEANLPKSPAADIYKLIDSDLSKAEELLPTSWPASYVGRLTWGAARALHARTYAMRCDWQKMLAAANDVKSSGLYNLDTPYDKIFTDDGENCSESVFELQCTSTTALPASTAIGSQFAEVQGIRGSGQWNMGWGWHMGTKYLGASYEAGDPRKAATLITFRKSESEPITAENTNTPYGESPVSSADGGYFNKKAYTDPAKRALYTKGGFWINIRIIRYSDVVLMVAEAACETGDLKTARECLEMVRKRARGNNASVLPEVTTNDQAELRAAIHNERRFELALEPGRFYDLVRWNEATKVLHAAGHTGYQDKHALLPIPQSVIDLSKGVLKQNPDYAN